MPVKRLNWVTGCVILLFFLFNLSGYFNQLTEGWVEARRHPQPGPPTYNYKPLVGGADAVHGGAVPWVGGNPTFHLCKTCRLGHPWWLYEFQGALQDKRAVVVMRMLSGQVPGQPWHSGRGKDGCGHPWPSGWPSSRQRALRIPPGGGFSPRIIFIFSFSDLN
jgi:hypothetical protein